MRTKARREEANPKTKLRNIRIRRSPEVARSLLWFEKSGKSVHTRTLNYDGGRGKIRTYHLGGEDARFMPLRPLEIWTEHQLLLLMAQTTYAGERALVPVELMQRVLGYSPKEFAEPV